MLSALIFILFVLFMVLKIPVAVAIGLATYIPFVIGGFDLISIPQQMATSTQSIPLLAIPFFLLAGVLFNNLGITEKIFNFSRSLTGWITGGLAHTIIIAECILSGCSGTALSDAVGLGTVGIKAMKDEGYEVPFSAAVTVCAAMLGPIIPPSVMMVIYAILANVSLAKLFLGGLLPGIVIAAVLMGQIYWMAKSKSIKCPAPTPFSFRQILLTLKDGVAALLAPAIIIYGMVGGIVTPTEAGILACFYSLVIGIIYRTLTLKGIKDALVETVIGTALIMYIIAISSAMGWLITMEGTPMLLADWLTAISTNKWVILTLINFFLLILGCLMETLPAMLISIPVLGPMAVKLGMDPLQFGVVLTLNLAIGILTPPIGLGLYTLCAMTGMKLETAIRETAVFIPTLVISLLLITYIPAISLWLPNLLFAK